MGIVIEFFYNGKRHTLEVIEIDETKNDSFKIKIDNEIIEDAYSKKVKNLTFNNLFYERQYAYAIGEMVNGLIILEQLLLEKDVKSKGVTTKYKAYRCKCENDGYEFVISETQINCGHGCSVCSGNIVVKGINDIATTNPEVVGFLVNKEDAYRYSKGSSVKVLVKCPCCGFKKYMVINQLVSKGYVTCDRCGDGYSYPCKFSSELFAQLSDQIMKWETEYSPEWIGDCKYDHYIELLNGRKIVVEMDGHFHYNGRFSYVNKNDEKKDIAAQEHDIDVIRINCNYYQIYERFEHIKENTMYALSDIFDMSNVDWDKCDKAGLSSKMIEVIDYYTSHPFDSFQDIADVFDMNKRTIREYVKAGDKLGMCEYVKHDGNRMETKPVIMHDANGNLIGVFKSASLISAKYPEENFDAHTINQCARENRAYKGYVFGYTTKEKYEEYIAQCIEANVA